MATIFKYDHLKGDTLTPVVYVDSINQNSYPVEMHNICIKYIRENNFDISIDSPSKRFANIVKTQIDINDKPDGYYYTVDEKNLIFTMFKKHTSVGYFYTSVNVSKLFTLTCAECPRIVPQVFNKPTLFEAFTDELKFRVEDFKNRNGS